MNLKKIAQLGRQAAMEKTGQRWVGKLLEAPQKAVRSISGVAPDAKMGVRDYARAAWSPKYKGLDRPPTVLPTGKVQPEAGFFKPLKPSGVKSLIPTGWNPPATGARTLDRTRQSIANALRLSNKAVPISMATGGAIGTADQYLYRYPQAIGESVGDLAGLNRDDTAQLVESMQGLNALKLLPHSLSSEDPLAQEFWGQTRRRAYPSMQEHAAGRYLNHPVRSTAVDAFRMLSPFGMASTALQRGIADPYPTIGREEKRKLYSNLLSSTLQDTEGVKNSPLLAQLTKQVPPDVRRRIIAGLSHTGTGEELASTATRGVDFGQAAATGLDVVRQRMEQEGIPSSGVPDAGAALVDAAFGGPSKDIEQEKEIWRDAAERHANQDGATEAALRQIAGRWWGGGIPDNDRDKWVDYQTDHAKKMSPLRKLHPSYDYGGYGEHSSPKSRELGDSFYTSLQRPDFNMPPAISKYLEQAGVPNAAAQIAAMSPEERMRLYAPEGTDVRYPDERSKQPFDPVGMQGLTRSTQRHGWRPQSTYYNSGVTSGAKSPLEALISQSKKLADRPSWMSRGTAPHPVPGQGGVWPANPGVEKGWGGLHYDPDNPIATIRAYADVADEKREQASNWKHQLDAVLEQLEQDPRMFGVDVRKLLLERVTRRYQNSEQGKRIGGMVNDLYRNRSEAPVAVTSR